MLSFSHEKQPYRSTKVESNILSTSKFTLYDLPVIYKVSALPLGPLWPHMETYMCWADPPCFQDDVSHCQG